MDTKIRLTVDAEFCRRAQDELGAMLLRQERNFAQRWHSRSSTQLILRVLPIVGIVLALVGEALTVGMMLMDVRTRTASNLFFAIAFAIFFVILLLIPRIVAAIRRWGARRSQQRALKRARRALQIARKLSPYEAEYDIKGDLLAYARGKNGEWTFAWHRKLNKFRERGLAMHAQHITAIFRRANSFMPSILVLHSDGAWIRTVLSEIGLRSESVDADGEFPEPFGEIGLNGRAAKGSLD